VEFGSIGYTSWLLFWWGDTSNPLEKGYGITIFDFDDCKVDVEIFELG